MQLDEFSQTMPTRVSSTQMKVLDIATAVEAILPLVNITAFVNNHYPGSYSID